ncbi:MAG: glycerol-3-phosphate 1-O-acyltransferase PlsY [Alphaproteobacteria bacterium]|jgi:glycerol-3-phosphate acyltransferase PlsY|nr:glycerol-3-phosphate 1-O-acyltransferase PlsY [Alphaproteobacteria bacterium]
MEDISLAHQNLYYVPGILNLLAAYLIGSIAFGFVLCKIFGYGDIRKIGSKNIGATNVLRTGNKLLALATLILDSGKGAIAVLVLTYFFATTPEATTTLPSISSQAYMLLIGFFAIIGHCFPVWLKFRGGKGVATTLGVFLISTPLLGLIACIIWLLMALIFRVSSLSALIAVGLTPLIAHYIYNDPNISGLCAMIAALVYLKHRENIKRLFSGQEPKINFSKK